MLVQERIRIPDDKMDYYKDLAEMYVGDDVSPDFYGWVFPKYDHVAVGTGTVVNKPGIKQYQQVCQQQLLQKCGVSPSLLLRLRAGTLSILPAFRNSCISLLTCRSDALKYHHQHGNADVIREQLFESAAS